MKDIISYHCRRLPLLSSEDTIFIQFFFTIGSIGLVCDNVDYLMDGLWYGFMHECLKRYHKRARYECMDVRRR